MYINFFFIKSKVFYTVYRQNQNTTLLQQTILTNNNKLKEHIFCITLRQKYFALNNI
jgi:hypothetical protein